MRTLPPGLQAHLDSGTTTLCHCWRVVPALGAVLGFTDHDRDLSFDSVTYEAQAGFSASEIESSLGLSVDNLEAAGALSSERLNEERLRAGDFDNAAVEIWLVNWQDVSQRLLLRKGNLGEVTHGSLGFTAELRGLAHELNQTHGRIYQFGCDAVLGDQRCGVDLDDPGFSTAAVVLSVEDTRRLVVSGADDFTESWFARGTALFTSGANAGRGAEIKFHRIGNGAVMIELWQPAAFAVTAGDALTLRAGCDKQFTTCRGKFANALNFRGFPHVPGDDFVLSYASQNDPGNDGGSRN